MDSGGGVFPINFWRRKYSPPPSRSLWMSFLTSCGGWLLLQLDWTLLHESQLWKLKSLLLRVSSSAQEPPNQFPTPAHTRVHGSDQGADTAPSFPSTFKTFKKYRDEVLDTSVYFHSSKQNPIVTMNQLSTSSLGLVPEEGVTGGSSSSVFLCQVLHPL